ncbi:protein MKS1-like [Miscanthus floridulus]|uniref:protein MKS1-like n=1 Tax=Miscanthus floridulus TaxID=154761 RepID=UPI00345AFE22
MAAASFDADVTRHGGAAAGTGRALGVHAASRKIGKPGARHGQQERKPVIIYMVSPKVIHVEAHEFLPLVQRLTGPEAAGRGDKKSSRPSTSGGGAGAGEESEGARSKTTRAAPPVRVKARALNRPAGPAVSVSVTATRQQQQQQAAAPSAAAAASASPSGLLFRDLSPLRGAALKGEHHHPLVSPGWLHHVGDYHFLSPGAAATLGSPSASFLDIFGPLSSQQQ